MGKRGVWTALRWVVAIGILAGGLATTSTPGTRAQDGGQGILETAALVPADALLFVSLNTDISSDQWLTAADLLDQGGLEDIVYGTTAQLVEESGLPAEWITPGSSLLGDEVSVALVTGGPNGFEPVLLLSSANPNQAFETARSWFLATYEGAVSAPPALEGVTAVEAPGNDAVLARVDDLLVLGTTFGARQALGVALGAEPALADQAAFEEPVDELEDDRILTAWSNGPALTASSGSLLGSAGAVGLGVEEAALLGPAYGLATGGYGAIGVWAEEDGFRLDARVLPGPRGDELTAPDDASELVERAPDDALLFVDGMDLGQVAVLRGYVDSIAFGLGANALFEDTGLDDPYVPPTIDESYTALEELIGFDVRSNLLDLLTDDYGLWLSSSSLANADDLTAVLVSGAGDPATVEASVDRLLTLLRLDSGDEVRFNRIQVGGATVTEILVPDGTSTGPLRLTVGVVEGQLLIGVGSGMEQYLDGPPAAPLAGSSRFEAALDALPDDGGGRFYLDVNALIDLQGLAALEPTGQIGDPLEDPQLASLEGIQALAAVTRMEDETQVTSVVLTIDADAVEPEEGATPGTLPDLDASPVVATAAGRPTKVTGVEPLPSGDRRILSVSPADGAALTSDGDGRVCVISPMGSREVCGGPVASVDERNVAWSPDGRRVAFTEDSARLLLDGDVHVIDRDAGELQNWTDDDYDGGIPIGLDRDQGAPRPLPVDDSPAWTTDGRALVFGRTPWDTEVGVIPTIIYRVDGPGSEPERVAPVAAYPLATFFGMAYAQDGRLVYTSGGNDPGDPAAGLFVLAADGREARQVLPSSEEYGAPSLLGVTSAGSALVSYPQMAPRYAGVGRDGPCPLGLVGLETTVRTPLRMTDGSCAEAAGVMDGGARVLLLSPSPLATGAS